MQRTFSCCECNGLWQWTRLYQIPPTVRCEAWFGFCRRKTLDPVKLPKTCCSLWQTCYEHGQCPKMVHNVYEWANRCSRHREIRATLCHHRRTEAKVNRIIRENRHFTISEVYEQCPEVSRTVVYEIVTEHLQYRKICARWVPRMQRRPSGMRRE